MRRPRGNGGRFLNKKNSNGGTTPEKAAGGNQLRQPPSGGGSQLFQVLRLSDGGVSSKGKNADSSSSTSPGSEVTSDHLYLFSGATNTTTADHPFQINHLHPSLRSFQDGANTGLGIAMASGNYYLKV